MPLQPVYSSLPYRSVTITDPFWRSRQQALKDVGLPHMWDQIVSTGRLGNFLNAAAGIGTFASPYYFDDSDVYKWLEACAYVQQAEPSPKLATIIDTAIAAVTGAQEADGYIDTFMQLKHPTLKFRNLISMHEMYCAGHLIEAAVALHDALGDDRLLAVAIKVADLLCKTFGPGNKPGYCGHEEIELALLRLATATGNKAYEDLATWFVTTRGSRPSPLEAELNDAESMKMSPYSRRMHSKNGVYVGEYCQDHAPVRDHTDVVGHAVRAMYLYIAATQIAAKHSDEGLSDAMQRTWSNLTERRMYITGGIGPSGENEGFTNDFDLPNATAYAETCAACGLAFWGQKLGQATGNSEFVDIVERALYNGALSGISLTTDRYFYANPIESRGRDVRVPWFDCACCPPNIARLIGSVGAYAVGVSDGAFWLNMPIALTAQAEFQGTKVSLRVESDYPWSGHAVVHIDPESPVDFELRVRIPEWTDELEGNAPGLSQEATYDNGYAVYSKRWAKGDTLTLDFGMPARWIMADPRVRDNLGRVALTRGPLVYCAEAIDNGFAPQLFLADPAQDVRVARSDELGGICKLTVTGLREAEDATPGLYVVADDVPAEEAELELVPYSLWANRGATDMQVWLRRQ